VYSESFSLLYSNKYFIPFGFFVFDEKKIPLFKFFDGIILNFIASIFTPIL
jgi:hypothetical protein